MEQKRLILYITLLFILFALWQAWQEDYGPTPPVVTTETAPESDAPPLSAQQLKQPAAAATNNIPHSPESIPTAAPPPITKGQNITVQTDTVRAIIQTQGGNIVRLDLIQYPESLGTPNKPEPLLSDLPDQLYIAQSGLIGPQGPDSQESQAVFQTSEVNYTLSPDQNTLDVALQWTNGQGLNVTKTFTFTRGQYDIQVRYDIANSAPTPWSGQLYAQFKQKEIPSTAGIFGLQTYTGGSLSTPEKSYEKLSFSDMSKKNLDVSTQGGWLAMQKRYFLGSWIPDPTQTNRYYSRAQGNIYTLGYVGPMITLPTGGTGSTSTTLYVGPEDGEILSDLAPNLDLTIDYGWLWPISAAIFWMMKHIHSVVGNWGWSIILVTLLIKILFYKLSEKSYTSMAKMRQLTPKMQALKERYSDDRQKMSQAVMELYKKEKINPLSGCLPMLVQIPFFIALYYVLIESVALRQSPFIFWIHDLAAKDPYFVLPLLMGISMFVQQKLSPKPPDPMQANIMMILPVLFTVFFLFFPAGLVLYWLTNNCLSILQQWYIMRRVEKNSEKNRTRSMHGKVVRIPKK